MRTVCTAPRRKYKLRLRFFVHLSSICSPLVRLPLRAEQYIERFWRTKKTSKLIFNELFRSHNGLSLMSYNDLPVGGHASMLSLSLRLWQLSDNGLNFAEYIVYSPSLHHPRTPSHCFGYAVEKIWLFPWENQFQVGCLFCFRMYAALKKGKEKAIIFHYWD